jgi:hypothetical protein
LLQATVEDSNPPSSDTTEAWLAKAGESFVGSAPVSLGMCCILQVRLIAGSFTHVIKIGRLRDPFVCLQELHNLGWGPTVPPPPRSINNADLRLINCRRDPAVNLNGAVHSFDFVLLTTN